MNLSMLLMVGGAGYLAYSLLSKKSSPPSATASPVAASSAFQTGTDWAERQARIDTLNKTAQGLLLQSQALEVLQPGTSASLKAQAEALLKQSVLIEKGMA